VLYAKRKVSLDSFFDERPDVAVDFIKVDTDGGDYEVLCGAERILDRHMVLGLLVEVQFHGISHLHSNLFANIDRLLREHGFSLFDLDVYHYTRGVLLWQRAPGAASVRVWQITSR
jgi:Methyltransferase FkbM domain